MKAKSQAPGQLGLPLGPCLKPENNNNNKKQDKVLPRDATANYAMQSTGTTCIHLFSAREFGLLQALILKDNEATD